jgi:hypothetical protein
VGRVLKDSDVLLGQPLQGLISQHFLGIKERVDDQDTGSTSHKLIMIVRTRYNFQNQENMEL